jgi:Clp amino terminal domain, pathogenicity island component
VAKATTVRFTEEMYARLDQASARTGLPVNSIVIAACLDWLQRHAPPTEVPLGGPQLLAPEAWREALPLRQAPRWATLRRAVELAAKPLSHHFETYPFDRFTDHAKELLTLAQVEAEKSGFSYIGTEHLLLACFGNAEFHSSKTLTALRVTYADVAAAIDKAIGDKRPAHLPKIIPTSRVKRVIEIAFAVGGSMGDPRVGTSHLLLALATEGNGIAAHVLSDLGATKERILSQLAQLSDP